ncbi:MAG: type II toxin-antitoxin system VapC family toxin [Bacillota bacterium]
MSCSRDLGKTRPYVLRRPRTSCIIGISACDAFIAASAISQDAVLIHRDSEFDRLGQKVRCLRL